jgi:hypothetical protein
MVKSMNGGLVYLFHENMLNTQICNNRKLHFIFKDSSATELSADYLRFYLIAFYFIATIYIY